MNKDSFLRYIENDRGCAEDRLDLAVKKGLRRAKNDKFDYKKVFKLAAASVFTLALCIIINFMPFSTVAERYYESRQKMMPGSSEVLSGLFKVIACNIEKYLGGI
jgi:hypothetical protein